MEEQIPKMALISPVPLSSVFDVYKIIGLCNATIASRKRFEFVGDSGALIDLKAIRCLLQNQNVQTDTYTIRKILV